MERKDWMSREKIEAAVSREPFVPFRIHLTGRRRFDVPFKHVIVFRKSALILFKGVKKEGSRVATGYEELPYEQIERIEPQGGNQQRRRKAS
jgi:hypothetical protein